MARIKFYNPTTHQWENADVAVEPDFSPEEAITLCSELSDFVTVNGNYVACNNNVLTA